MALRRLCNNKGRVGLHRSKLWTGIHALHRVAMFPVTAIMAIVLLISLFSITIPRSLTPPYPMCPGESHHHHYLFGFVEENELESM